MEASPSNEKQFIVVQIRNRDRTLKDWFGGTLDQESLLIDVFAEFASGSLDHGFSLSNEFNTVAATVRVGSSSTGPFINVQPNLRLVDVKPLGIYVVFDVNKCVEPEAIDVDATHANNAFNLMMGYARDKKNKNRLPDVLSEVDSSGRKLNIHVLKNKFREFLAKNKVGWSEDALKKYGTSFINAVSECLWYIDGHHETLKGQGCSVPVELSHLQNYNLPEKHRHKRKLQDNICKGTLHGHILALNNVVSCAYMRTHQWETVRHIIEKLVSQLSKYHAMLEKKVHATVSNQNRTVTTEDDEMKVLDAKLSMSSNVTARYSRLVEALSSKSISEPLCVDDFTPTDRRRRHEYLKNLILPIRTVFYQHSSGKTNVHFLWRVSPDAEASEILESSVKVRDNLRQTLPSYHTRAMKREFISSFGTMTGTKSAVLREMYRRLTGDAAAANCMVEEQVDERVRELMESEDPDVIWDLRLNNKGRPEAYNEFLQECRKFIDAKIDTAVDDRRHDSVTEDDDGSTSVCHLAMAISAVDLHRQVCETLPAGVATPSVQWLRLQFWPRNRSHASSKYYTGRLKLKFMVQARQFRQSHIDCHYASALFKYEKEFCIKYRLYTDFIAMDDKHTCKVGEPGYPVAAAERGRQVVVGKNQSFQVGDHDFTKVSVTPSVTMDINIPEDIQGSFHDGQIYVGVKENCFEPSSPLRHMKELCTILQKKEEQKPILCIYTDGGPDHRLTYLSVQIALICVFLLLNKDMLIAVRTPPHNSWKNPPERVMSILNQGLQCIGLMRQKCTDEIEEELLTAKTMKCIRDLADENPEIKNALLTSVKPVKELMGSIFRRLNLKGKFFEIFDPATPSEIDSLFSEMSKIDPTLTQDDTTKQKAEKRSDFQTFLRTHCVQRSYMFSVKKCDQTECNICMPPVLPNSIFSSLHHLPDPVPNGDHYKPFSDVYGSNTTEKDLPSLKEKESQGHKIPFNPSQQTAKNTGVLLKCCNCSKSRLLHCKHKLKPDESLWLKGLFESMIYSCGSNIHDIDVDNSVLIVNGEEKEAQPLVDRVFVKLNLVCKSIMELPYYSAGYGNVCIHCGDDEKLVERDEKYPMCAKCVENKKRAVNRRGGKGPQK